MTDKKERVPGRDGPGQPGDPPLSLETPAGPGPSQPKSGTRIFHVTAPSSPALAGCKCSGLANCGNKNVGNPRPQVDRVPPVVGRSVSEGFAGLIGGVPWVGGNDMRGTVIFVPEQDPSPRRRWVRQMLANAPYTQAAHDEFDPEDALNFDAGAGVREPVKRPPPLPPGVVALPLPEPEKVLASV